MFEKSIELILGELNVIRWLLSAIVALYGVTIVGIVATLLFLIKTYKTEFKPNLSFKRMAQEMLEMDKIEELIDYSQSKIETHPNHDYANFFLALALYHKGLIFDAKRAFLKTRKLKPNWADEYIDPYLHELEIRIQEHKPKVVS